MNAFWVATSGGLKAAVTGAWEGICLAQRDEVGGIVSSERFGGAWCRSKER